MNWDRVGGVASGLCAVHCVLTGLALGFLSLWGLDFLASHTAELLFLSVALTAGLIASWTGVRRHQVVWLPIVFFAGLGLLLARHSLFPHAHVHGPGEVCEPPLAATFMSVGAGLLLVGFHVANAWLGHRRPAECASAPSL